MSEPMSIEQVQNCCMEMLSFFDKYAKKNNLVYYLSGGTLLGAIRHRGFIPWDDDVDLMLPREDYERLIRNFSDEKYCISSCECDSDYKTPYARMWDTNTSLNWELTSEKKIGVFIDLFPIDGFPNSAVLTRVHLLHIRYYEILSNASVRLKFRDGEKHRFLKKTANIFVRKNGNYYSNCINKIAKEYRFSECDFVGVKVTSKHLFLEKNNKNIFRETLLKPFENLLLPVPIGYDTYLKHLYGEDYMQLPPKENRKSTHYFTFMGGVTTLQIFRNIPKRFFLKEYA